MNKKIASLVVLVGLFGLVGLAFAQVTIPNPLNGVNNFCQLLTSITTVVGGLIATLGIIMIVVAGIFYLTSAGSPEKIKTAKTALIYAIVGIVIGIAAGAIVDVIKTVISAGPGGC